MMIEVATALFLLHGVRVFSRLIDRRHDVLYYVETRR
jgi:hypothetical protein